MKTMMNWLEKYLVPVAAKISGTRWLVALRDSFIATLPITMAGSLATLLSALVQTYAAGYGLTGLVKAAQPLVLINNTVVIGSLGIFAFFFAGMWGYHLSLAYRVDPAAGILVALSAFAMGINNSASVTLAKPLGGAAKKLLTDAGMVVAGKSVAVSNAFTIRSMGASSLFTAMAFGALALAVYIYLVKKDVQIKMPDTVPPAVSKAFGSLLPAAAAVYVIAIVNYLFTWATGQVFGDWLSATIQAPLLHAGQSVGMVLLVTFLVQLLWFFGIHGSAVLQPVLDSLWNTAQLANMAAVQAHTPLPYKWVRGSWDAFAWYGGAGGTIILLIAILWVSKRADEKAVAKLAFVPGLFNINEPVMFGLPVVLNAMYFIPFILAPLVNTAVAYGVTMAGWVSPVSIGVPWITPPLLDAWMATNFDFRALILAAFNMVVAFLIWLPFVLASSRLGPTEAEADEQVEGDAN